MKATSTQFAVCISNQDCDDLELLKVYQVVPDRSAAKDNYIRVIDESGEDYLYPGDYFTFISLSSEEKQTLLPLFEQKYSSV